MRTFRIWRLSSNLTYKPAQSLSHLVRIWAFVCACAFVYAFVIVLVRVLACRRLCLCWCVCLLVCVCVYLCLCACARMRVRAIARICALYVQFLSFLSFSYTGFNKTPLNRGTPRLYPFCVLLMPLYIPLKWWFAFHVLIFSSLVQHYVRSASANGYFRWTYATLLIWPMRVSLRLLNAHASQAWLWPAVLWPFLPMLCNVSTCMHLTKAHITWNIIIDMRLLCLVIDTSLKVSESLT